MHTKIKREIELLFLFLYNLLLIESTYSGEVHIWKDTLYSEY